MIGPTGVRSKRAKDVMDRIPGQRRRRNLGAAVALVLAFPAIAMGWGGLKVLFGPGRWRSKLIALSIFGNVLFVFVMVLGYYVSQASPRSPEEEVALLGTQFIPCVNAPLHFVEAHPQSELRSALEHSVYVSFNGSIRTRFDFTDGVMDTLKEVQLFDKYGRPWISAPLEAGKLSFTRYYDEKSTTDGDVTLVDEDRDGMPDVLIDWEIPARYERDDIKWHLVKKGN